MELTNQVNKYKNLIPNILVIGICLLIANNIYKKQNKEIEDLKYRIESETKKNQIIKQISELENKVAYYRPLFRRPDSGAVISNVTALAQSANVKISSIRPAGEQSLNYYSKASFELSVIAPSYHNLGRFVAGIESFSDFYAVQDITIKSAGQKGELIATLRLNVISIKE
ncbi:MAG: type 4a pilus biogenesis protein PilO [Candidatus Omnitrophica bacterium]|nr:type 4a pilus biogenesis protein PilO [Candidatus Omnitrophota bacterium]MBU1870062.1 type 4a pilus biogenesis protein PilO [Candidatus Omnitrophota bacterium]